MYVQLPTITKVAEKRNEVYVSAYSSLEKKDLQKWERSPGDLNGVLRKDFRKLLVGRILDKTLKKAT